MPRFSVLIPTRNRPAQLRACLETVAAQTFHDFEVIVQDNSDSPFPRSGDLETFRADGSFSRRPISRVFNRRVLAMSANWDAAFARCSGEYVTVVGDDDGLYPTCLEAADRLIRANDLDALRWGQSVFVWPDPENGRRGSVDFPGDRGYMQMDHPHVRAITVLAGGLHYGELPMIYTGCVRRSLLQSIKDRCGGRLFPTKFPDLWSGLAVCATAKRVGWLYACLAISGSTRTSTGAHLFDNREGDPVCEEFERLAGESGLYWHADVAGSHPLAAQLHDTYLWVRDLLGWPEGFPALDRVEPAGPGYSWFAPADVITATPADAGPVKTVADAARFCHAFTRGLPPEVLIEELRREVVELTRANGRVSALPQI